MQAATTRMPHAAALVSVAFLADSLGLTRGVIYARIQHGTLACVKLTPRCVRVLLDDAAELFNVTSIRDGRDQLEEATVFEPLMGIKDAARALSVSTDLVLALIQEGSLRAYQDRPSACYRIKREDLIGFLQSRRVPCQWEPLATQASRRASQPHKRTA